MIAQQLLNGIVVGSVYALFALGFTLIFGVYHVLNLAHGAVFMIGAFSGRRGVSISLSYQLPVGVTVVLTGGDEPTVGHGRGVHRLLHQTVEEKASRSC